MREPISPPARRRKQARLSPAMLTAFGKAWSEVAAEAAAADADFRRPWDSLQAFRKDYALWRDLGYLR